jgi:hypothetical protein
MNDDKIQYRNAICLAGKQVISLNLRIESSQRRLPLLKHELIFVGVSARGTRPRHATLAHGPVALPNAPILQLLHDARSTSSRKHMDVRLCNRRGTSDRALADVGDCALYRALRFRHRCSEYQLFLKGVSKRTAGVDLASANDINRLSVHQNLGWLLTQTDIAFRLGSFAVLKDFVIAG